LGSSLKNVTRIRQIARDGRTFSVDYGIDENRPELAKTALIETLEQTVRLAVNPRLALEPYLRELGRPRSLRTHFHGVAGINGSLLLETPHGQLVSLQFSTKPERFVLRPLSYPTNRDRLVLQPFRLLPAVTPWMRYRLSVATFPDGSQVFLDSRGLLHLKSSDRRIPEATFVMHDNDAAGWSADGRMWGSSYFLGSMPAAAASEIHKSIFAPFVHRLS
jgi:hypothetical protein